MLTLQKIEDIAPDQASLASAKKLLSNGKWQGQGFCATTHTAWGECQGSGSKPYYVVVDVADTGYKCTCPSRKFPCKHALALMWRYVQDSSPFAEAPTPQWVSDWLGRRRKTKPTDSQADEKSSTPKPKKSIALAEMDAQKESQETDPKKQASIQKRTDTTKAKTDAQISTGLDDFAGWLDDQIRMGLGAFLDNATTRCRQGASRLVDAKASTLASAVDDLPSVILATPKTDRANRVLGEFGRWYLLMRAWAKDPDNPDVRRAIVRAENKDVVLDNPNAFSVQGMWQVVGEQVLTRKDGLISHTTFLVHVGSLSDSTPHFATLQDFYHPTSGVKTISQLGAVMAGELVYYPSAVPSRAFFQAVETLPKLSKMYYDPSDNGQTDSKHCPQELTYPTPTDSLHTAYAKQRAKLPWLSNMPYLLLAGHIAKDEQGRYWYVSESETILLKNKDLSELSQGINIKHAFIVYDGYGGELLSVDSEWGLISC